MLNMDAIREFFTGGGGYVLEILFSLGLFCLPLERKRGFGARLLLTAVLFFAFTAGYQALSFSLPSSGLGKSLSNIFRYLLYFLLSYGGIMLCFDAKPAGVMFVLVCGSATQHLAFRAYSCVLALGGMTYSSPAAAWVIVGTYAAVLSAVWFLLVRRLRRSPEQYMNNRLNVLMGAIIILITVVLHFLIEPYANIEAAPAFFLLVSGYSMICCVMTLMVEHGLFRNQALSEDKELLEQLVYQQREQYRVSKDNIDMINIKVHDMRHQISRLTRSDDPDMVRELEEIISIYDSRLKTGNEILDTCLMEKALLCEKNHIAFDCIADGESLSFMAAADIFALFGNAIENAVDASRRIANEKKRIISLNISRQLGMTVVHLENNYDGELTFADGLPQTTKEDRRYHGFGVRSIQLIAEKYHGQVAMFASDGIFNLNITFPAQEALSEDAKDAV